MTTAVVYVHGLWLRGYEGLLLRRRLAAALDAEAYSFSYPSVSSSMADNARALYGYLRQIRADTVHLVAHSLGGLVILELFEATAVDFPSGRIVLLGSPVQGSLAAQRLARLPLGLGQAFMGFAGDVLAVPRERRWGGARELGVIAGDLPLGAGRLLGHMGEPNDGTVLVRETDLPGAAGQLRLRVSHSGMPYSPTVARQAAAFLRLGRFE
jgi:pimeloyl-ACP methyl ester carboxylesterase